MTTLSNVLSIYAVHYVDRRLGCETSWELVTCTYKDGRQLCQNFFGLVVFKFEVKFDVQYVVGLVVLE